MKLSLLNLLLMLQCIQGENLEETLLGFKKELDIYSIIAFGYNVTTEIWPRSDNLELPPQFLITHENVTNLRGSQGERVLSLLFVDYFEKIYLEEIFKPSLLNLHWKDVLFYTEKSLESVESWEWLFSWCWREGFWHVLLMNEHEGYLTMETLPVMLIKPTTLTEYLRVTKRRPMDLKGYPIRVTVGNYPPRVNAYYNEEGELQLSGFYGRAAKMFISQFNATMEYVIMPNMSHYSVLSCIEYILEHWTDICSDATLYGNGIETTRPFFIVTGCLMVPFDTPLENYKYFRMPFTNQVWLIIFLSFISSTALLILVEYKEHKRIEIIKNLFSTFESLICCSISLNHLSAKYRYGLEALLIFSGFFLTNCYLAYLSSILLTKIFRRDIDSIRDVAEHNLTILTTDYHQYILEVTNATHLVRQQTKLVSEEEYLINLKSINSEYVYFDLDSRFDYYLYQQKFLSHRQMKILTSEWVTTDIGEIPMRSYWPFQDLFTEYMDNLFSSGIFTQFTIETQEEGIRMGELEFTVTKGLSAEPLSLEYFVLCGLLLVGGYTLSIVCFLMEIFVHREIKRK